MEVLELNGKEYVKASLIAKELGYTADYVGQLCRNKKVDAQLVGRSWYVLRDSIVEHKSDRYRSNTTKAKAALKEQVQTTEKDAHRVKIRKEADSVKKNNFYTRLAYDPAAKYTSDEADLIPALKEKVAPTERAQLQVRLAGEKVLDVDDKSATNYNFKATERPKIRFKGDLVVEEPDEAAIEPLPVTAKEKAVKVETKAQPERHLEVQGPRERNKEVAIEARETPGMVAKRFSTKIALHSSEAVAEPIRVNSSQVNEPSKKSTPKHEGGELQLNRPRESRPLLTRLPVLAYVSASLIVALATSTLLIFVEQSLTSTQEQQTATYNFNMSSLVSSLYR